jgi:hypothetical protein
MRTHLPHVGALFRVASGLVFGGAFELFKLLVYLFTLGCFKVVRFEGMQQGFFGSQNSPRSGRVT